MNDTVLTVIISATAGVIGGGITSLVAPWVQWNIKKREKQYETRQRLLEEWRTLVKDLAHKPAETPEGHNWQGWDFLEAHPSFTSLRKHISDERDFHGWSDDALVGEVARLVNEVADKWKMD